MKSFFTPKISIVFFSFFVLLSLFSFSPKVEAATCESKGGTCVFTSCEKGQTVDTVATCTGGAQWFCCAGEVITCDGTCTPGPCGAAIAAGTGSCGKNGGSCCSNRAAPLTGNGVDPTTKFVSPAASSGGSCSANDFSGGIVVCGKGNGPGDCDFDALICLLQRIMNFLMFVIAAPLVAIRFAWAGWLMMKGKSILGSPKDFSDGVAIFINAGAGLLWMFSAWLIVHAVVLGLGVSSTYNLFLN